MQNLVCRQPIFERCDLPSVLQDNEFISQPGLFLHGPDENSGFIGRSFGMGFEYVDILLINLFLKF